MKWFFGLMKETFADWSADKASRLAAALAYYTIFSLAPLLVIVIAIAGLVLQRQDVQNQVLGQISGLAGQEGSSLVKTMIQSAQKPSSSIIATVLGVITLLLGASGVFGALQDSLNTIWEVAPRPGRGIWTTVRERFVSFTMVLGIGFLLLVSLVISAALSAVGRFISGAAGMAVIGQVINFVVSFGVITLLFALIYKVLPDVEISWGDVWIGAAFTSLLFTIGRFLIGLYLGRSSVGSTYGAAGSLVVLLLWIYYSAQILFLGAEFTQVYAKRSGSRIRPNASAVAVTDDMRAQQGMPTGKKPVTPVPGEQVATRGKQSAQPQPATAAASERARAAMQSASRGMQQSGFRLPGAAITGIILGLVAGFAQFGGDKKKPVKK